MESSNPKVSIVVPVYNVEAYLVECLESLRRQTLSSIEVVCVNDGSTDGSLAILESYAARDNRFRVLDFENGGYGRAMNRGIASAQGEYVGIVEPDDYVALTMYEDLSERADENQLDFIKADFYRFKRNDKGDMRLFYNHIDRTGSRYNTLLCPAKDPSTLRFIMNTWSGIYRKSFLEKYSICHNETPGASFQDNGFWFQTFVHANRAMIVDTPYYRNRRDNPTSSVKDPGKIRCMKDEYDYIQDILMRDAEIWERFSPMFWVYRYKNYLGTAKRIEDSEKLKYLCDFSREFAEVEQKGYLEKEAFLPEEWSKLRRIIDDPQTFYSTEFCKKSRGRASSGFLGAWKRAKRLLLPAK